MNERDIAALMRGVAPVLASLVAAATKPLEEKIAALKSDLEAYAAFDPVAAIRGMIEEAVAAIPPAPAGKDADPADIARLVNEAVSALPPAKDGEPGKDADPGEIARMVAEAVAAIPMPKDGEPGKDADPAAVEAMVAEKVAAAVAALPPAEPGKDADPELVRVLVAETVERAVADLPRPKDGTSVTIEDVRPLVERAVADAVAALPPAKDGEPGLPGKDGAPGLLPLVKAWTDAVAYAGEVRAHRGSTYQALRDTAKEPPHEDWICLAGRGEDGKAARQIVVRETYDPNTTYSELEIVALNGGAYIARKDDPGVCPGEGWQQIAMRGKAGPPGEARKGDPGKSIKGDPGAPVAALSIDDAGMLTLVNGDGSIIQCDLYPLLSRLG